MRVCEVVCVCVSVCTYAPLHLRVCFLKLQRGCFRTSVFVSGWLYVFAHVSCGLKYRHVCVDPHVCLCVCVCVCMCACTIGEIISVDSDMDVFLHLKLGGGNSSPRFLRSHPAIQTLLGGGGDTGLGSARPELAAGGAISGRVEV